MGFIGFLTKNKRRFESRRCGFTPFAPLDSKRTENEHIRNICSYPDNVPATYRPDRKSAKKSSLFEGVELAARCAELLPSAFGSQPSAFSSADSATGGADFKRSSKREVLFLV